MKRTLLFPLAGVLLNLAVPPGHASTLDSCFSPAGHCDQVMISWINASLKTLDGAIYGLTDENIAQALIRAHQRGVQVRLVHDESQAAGQNDVTQELIDAGIPVHIQRGSEGGILHDKFLVIDNRYVLTGSFNWTNSATARNDENFVVLDDQASNFQQEFERLWSQPQTAVAPRPARSTSFRRPWWPTLFTRSLHLHTQPFPPATPYPHARRHHRHHRHKTKRKSKTEILVVPVPIVQ